MQGKRRRRFISRAIGAIALFGAVSGPLCDRCLAGEGRYVFKKAEMGVPCVVTVCALDRDAAARGAEAAFARIEELNTVLSDYDSDSELSRLSVSSGSGRPVPVSADLWQVIERSQEIAEKTDGAFDVTIGPLVNLWRRMRRKQELPSADSIAEMRSRVGYRNMRLNPATRSVELLKPEMRLDVGGIAKGFAASEAVAAAARAGARRSLVALSGDIAAGDPPPGDIGWRVEVESLQAPGAPPPQVLLLANRAVSTSGDAYQNVEIGGIRHSHIIDPATGIGLTGRSMVTVVAPDGLTADGWDTPIEIIGPERGLRLIAELPGAEMRMQILEGDRVRVVESPGWQAIPKAPLPSPAPLAAPAK